MQGKAARVPSSPLLGLRNRQQTARVSHQGGKTAFAPEVCAPAFLTTKVEPIRPTENKVAMQFGINIESSYKRVMACCRRFMKFVGMKFDFVPTKGLSRSQQLGELIEYFEKKIEPLGLSLCVSKKTPQGEEKKVLECVVYREGLELNETIIILYAAPARYLSEGTSALYKRFFKFVSDCTNIPLGINDHGENFYLDMLLNCEDAFDFEEPEEPDADSVVMKYREDGEFWNLFDEIYGLPQETDETLLADMRAYRKDCPNEEVDLLDAMIEGVPIIKDANFYWFEFNPEDDGLPNEYGSTDCDGWASSVFASAILFSEHDGMGEQLLDCVNNEVNAGIMMSGFNIHQWLSPTTKKEDIDEFMRCKDLAASLDKWTCLFYGEASKFDLYGKSK